MPGKDDKYTDPKLREEVKEELKESDKGGAPGQWSARKAQMMASEYKKRGGGYTTDKKDQDESQKNLSKWGDEEWQTKDGSGNAKQDDGTEKRYLPKKAWEQMSEKEKEETDQKKLKESKEGKQFVGNTNKAKNERKKASEDQDDQDEDEDETDGQEDYEQDDEDDKEDEEEEYEDQDEDEDEEDQGDENGKAGQKRSKPDSDSKQSKNKKQKSSSEKSNGQGTVGSKKDSADPPARRASNERLPEKGQKVFWKALPGFVEGNVIEVVFDEKTVEGKDVKAGQDDPRVVLKSASSGKIAVHKPDAIFFD